MAEAEQHARSPKRIAVAWAILIAVAIALLIVLPALADWLSRSN
jgi:hypothetical protein